MGQVFDTESDRMKYAEAGRPRMIPLYTARARKNNGKWVVTVPDVPSFHYEGTSASVQDVREHLAETLKEPFDSFKVMLVTSTE